MEKLGIFFKTLGTKIVTLWKTTTWFKIASIGGAVVIVASAVIIPNAVISDTDGLFHECDYSVENIDVKYSYSVANCTEKAKYYYSCACGEKGTQVFEYGNALGHDLMHHEGKPATCTEHGYDAYDACFRCGYTTYNAIPKNGHNIGSWEYVKATCTNEGYKFKQCSDCNQKFEMTITNRPTGHTPDSWITVIEPTCVQEGEKIQICTKCNDTLNTTPIFATPHTYGDWIIDKAATCTEGGSKHQICSVCKATKSENITKLGHTDGEWITDVDATCTEDGSKHQICSVCEATIKTEGIVANGHNFGDWYIVQEATCAVNGKKERVCECTVKETVPYSSEHPSEFVSATKSDGNYIATWYCPICSVNFDKEFDPITATCDVHTLNISAYATIIWKLNASGGIGDYRYTILMYEQKYTGSANYILKETWNNETNPIFAYSKSNTSQLSSLGYMFRITISDGVGSVTYEYWFDNYLNSDPSRTYIYTAYTLKQQAR